MKKRLLRIYFAIFVMLFGIGLIYVPAYACTPGDTSPVKDYEEEKSEGDEINIESGNFTEEIVDFNIPQPGIPIVLKRSYHSTGVQLLGLSSGIGNQWTFSFTKVLHANFDGSTDVQMGNGVLLQFYPADSNGERSPKLGTYGVLKYYNQNGDDYYTVMTREGLMHKFELVTGRIYKCTEIKDISGNKITIVWGLDAQGIVAVSKVQDTYGNDRLVFTYTYSNPTYTTTVQEKKLDGSNGRKIDYLITWLDGNRTVFGLYQVNYPDNSQAHYTYTPLHIDWPTYTTYYGSIATFQDPRAPKGYTYMELGYNYDGTSMPKAASQRAPQDANDFTTNTTVATIPTLIVGYGSNVRSMTYANDRVDNKYLNINNSIVEQYNDVGEGNLAIRKHIDYYVNDTMKKNLRSQEIYYAGANALTTKFEYDWNQNVTKLTDADGNITTSSYLNYDGFGMSGSYGLPLLSSTTNAKGQTTSYIYDTSAHLMTVTNNLGYQAKYTYNARGQVTTMTDALTNVTNYFYYPDTNTWSNNPNRPAGFLWKTEKLVDTGSTTVTQITEYLYDIYGRRWKVIDSNGVISQTTYDLNDRVTKSETLSSTGTTILTSAQYAYDTNGNRVTVIDANNKVTRYVYNNADRLIAVITPASTGTDTVTTFYAYDNMGNRTGIKDGRGKITNYTYDPIGRLLNVKDAENKYKYYEYDDLGNITKTWTTGTGGVTLTNIYDNLNRLVSESQVSGSTVSPITSYTYDELGNKITMTHSTGTNTTTLTYEYDGLNRLTRIKAVNGNYPQTDYEYDANNNRINMKVTGIGETTGKSATYEYYKNNWLKSVTDECGFTTTYEYDVLGNRTKTIYPSTTHVTTTYAYETNTYRLTNITSLKSNGTTVTLQNLSYDYDAVGNRQHMYDTHTGTLSTTSYTYDNLYQLKTVTYPNGDTTEYTYDAVGNRTQMVETGTTNATTTYNYLDANELNYFDKTGQNRVSYTYDVNGNQITKGDDKDYTWNVKGQLTNVAGFTNNIAYEYDGDGRRTKKTAGSNLTITEYIYDGANCVAETNGAGLLKSVFVHGAELISKKTSCTEGIMYYLYDAMGNTMVMVDNNGAEIVRYVYDAFGAIRTQIPPGDPANNRNLFVGGHGIQYDDEDNLTYMRARYYDSETGRFISRDPMKGINAKNRYSYCSNNPINLSDENGNCEEVEAIYAYQDGDSVIYINSDGSWEERSGGSKSWMNNNPGNLVPGSFTDKRGAIGEAFGFAVFPDTQTGTKAASDLLKTEKYKKLTVDQAIEKWSVPASGDKTGVRDYQKAVQKQTGISGNTKVGKLDDSQRNNMIQAIKRHEGWQEGTIKKY